MDELHSLSHTKWNCKYHVVFIPKCRRKTLYVELRRHFGEIYRKLAVQKGPKIEEGHLIPDHACPYSHTQLFLVHCGAKKALGNRLSVVSVFSSWHEAGGVERASRTSAIDGTTEMPPQAK
jgi:Transposase IS200 like